MRKFYFLFLILLLPFWVNSQNKAGIEHLTQNFSGTFPPQGWSIENYNSQWTQSNTSYAKGVAPELKFTYTNGSLTTRFISPVVNLSGVTNLSLSFKHFVDHYGAGYTIGVATRSNNGTWNTVWSVSPSSDISENRIITISNADVGSSTFQFCLFLSGNAYQIDYWFIDDIILYTPHSNDLSLSSIDVNKYIVAGNTDVKATVKNLGLNNISSFTLNYRVNDGTTISENVSGLNLTTNSSYTYTFSQKWLSNTGNYSLNIWATNINGGGDDDDASNNSLTKPIMVASNSVPNMPFFESFTSSTCAPCYTFNTNTFTPFLNTNAGQYAIIKYQMNWPGTGDPYYTAEGGTRRTYYGVSAVPSLFTGGNTTATSGTALNAAYNAEKAKPSFFTISPKAYILGTTVHATIDITPYITINNLKVHAAVIERETRNNVASNGETSFKYVMMKMLPNASGTTVNFTDGVTHNLSFTQNLTGTNVEEYHDLMLVVFIQNDENKEIMQSIMINSPLSYTVTFNVKNEASNPIENAVVTIGDENYTTNSDGICTAVLPNGNHGYTVDAFGYSAASGEVTVSNANTSVNVTLSPVPTYTAIFIVKDDNDVLIENASVTYDNRIETTNSEGVAIFETESGSFDYSIDAEGYLIETGTALVADESITINVTLSPQPYPVTFDIKYTNEAPIVGASIQINGETLTSDSEGKATIEIINGEYAYTVNIEGYMPIEGIVVVAGEAITVEIIVPLPQYEVTFVVTSGENIPEGNATISINQETITTNAEGQATIMLEDGIYDYSVNKEGFAAFSGSVTVNGENKTVNVQLTHTSIKPNQLFSATLYPNPNSGQFSISIPNASERVRVKVINALGAAVMEGQHAIANGKIDVNISQPKGVYFVTLTLANGQKQTLKLVID